jgi:uncharacterized protein YkwD
VLALALLVSGCVGGATSDTEPSPDATGSVSVDAVNTTEIEQAVHYYVNQERTTRGLEPVDWNSTLADVAQYHSNDMAMHRYAAHTAPDGETMRDRYERFDIPCKVKTGDEYALGGENLVTTYADSRMQTKNGIVDHNGNETDIARGIVNSWLNSPAHRDNMLNPIWTQEGVGVTTELVDGNIKVYATQNFC